VSADANDLADLPQGVVLPPPRITAKPAAVAAALGRLRRRAGWPDSTAEERERNVRDFIDSLEDA
jgi:hypothetical protein